MLEQLKEYFRNKDSSVDDALLAGWSESEIYLAKQELRNERKKFVWVAVVALFVLLIVFGGAFAASETGGEIFRFLSGKVITVYQHAERVNDSDIKYSFWIGTHYDNAECFKPQDCITTKGEGWGCIDNVCVELSEYGG